MQVSRLSILGCWQELWLLSGKVILERPKLGYFLALKPGDKALHVS